jgi:hypothetical protein
VSPLVSARCVWGALAGVPSCGGTASRPARGARGGVVYVPPWARSRWPQGATPPTPASSSPCSARRNNSHNWSNRSSTPRACRRGRGATDRDAVIAHRGLRPDQSTAAQERLSGAKGIHDRRPIPRPARPSRRMDRRREPHQGRARLLSECTSRPSRSRDGRAVRTTRLTPARRAQAPAAPDTSAGRLTRGRQFAHSSGRHCRLAHDRVARRLASQHNNRPWHGRPPS